MEASFPVISENLSTERNPSDRSICSQIISSDQDLLFVETRPIEPSNRCLPTKLVPRETLCFSPILHDLKSFEQSPERQSIYDDPSNASLVITTVWYPEAIRMSIQQPILLTWRRDLLKSSKGEIHPLVQNKTIKLVAWTVSGLDYNRKEFQGRLPTLSLNQEDQVLTEIMNL